jgi:hypothetical protein
MNSLHRPLKVLEEKDRGLAILVGAVGAIVFLEGVLRQAVEGERGYGAFETRSGQTPRTVGAAPAGEVIPFDPDQAFTHTSPDFCVRLGLELGRRRAEHINIASAEGELRPVAGDYFPWICVLAK